MKIGTALNGGELEGLRSLRAIVCRVDGHTGYCMYGAEQSWNTSYDTIPPDYTVDTSISTVTIHRYLTFTLVSHAMTPRQLLDIQFYIQSPIMFPVFLDLIKVLGH